MIGVGLPHDLWPVFLILKVNILRVSKSCYQTCRRKQVSIDAFHPIVIGMNSRFEIGDDRLLVAFSATPWQIMTIGSQ